MCVTSFFGWFYYSKTDAGPESLRQFQKKYLIFTFSVFQWRHSRVLPKILVKPGLVAVPNPGINVIDLYGRKLEQLKKERLMEIGKRLYECRKKRKWSQLYVANKLEISTNTVSAIENGVQQFNLMILLQFSELYEVSTDYILQGKTQETYDRELIDMIMRIQPIERRRVMAAIEAFYAVSV